METTEMSIHRWMQEHKTQLPLLATLEVIMYLSQKEKRLTHMCNKDLKNDQETKQNKNKPVGTDNRRKEADGRKR